jgi:drug/metabolite transporter (DMT)-like permease
VATLAPCRRPWWQDRETAGFLVSLAFVCLASVRDVYLGGLFQRLGPAHVAIVAFTLCALVFLPVAAVRRPGALRALLRRPRALCWVNATSAVAWISFFHALRLIEPACVQILFAGIGPITVTWLDRRLPGAAPGAPLLPAERPFRLGLVASLIATVAVTLAGLSGAGPIGLGAAAAGAALALGAGIAISASTVLCRTLHDEGIDPLTLVGLRFVGAVVLAAALAGPPADALAAFPSGGALAVVAAAALLLIVIPVYVSQVGIALASPLTVRVALSLAPVLIFALELAERRLSSSPSTLAVAAAYSLSAIGGALARRRARPCGEMRVDSDARPRSMTRAGGRG